MADRPTSTRCPRTRTTARSGSTCAIGFPIPTHGVTASDFIRYAREQRPETAFAIAVEVRRSAALGFICTATSSACRRRSATGSASRSGAGDRDRSARGGHPLCHRGPWPDAPLRPAFAGTRRRAACSRKPATCWKGACAAAPSRTAASSTSCSTRSSPDGGPAVHVGLEDRGNEAVRRRFNATLTAQPGDGGAQPGQFESGVRLRDLRAWMTSPGWKPLDVRQGVREQSLRDGHVPCSGHLDALHQRIAPHRKEDPGRHAARLPAFA